jgi:hypothetical protein
MQSRGEPQEESLAEGVGNFVSGLRSMETSHRVFAVYARIDSIVPPPLCRSLQTMLRCKVVVVGE